LKVQTTRFGVLELENSNILTFTEGLLGFPDYTKYVLLDHDKSGIFQWLQSVENEDLAFVLIEPLRIVPDYRVEVHEKDVEDIKLQSPDTAVMACIVNIGKDCSSVTVNLLGPIVINPREMLAKQIVLVSSQYSIRHDIMAEALLQPSAAARKTAQR